MLWRAAREAQAWGDRVTKGMRCGREWRLRRMDGLWCCSSTSSEDVTQPLQDRQSLRDTLATTLSRLSAGEGTDTDKLAFTCNVLAND